MTDTQATEASEKAGTNPRETEQTPVMLRKASQLLLIGALFPFYTGVKYASTAAQDAGGDTMGFDWATLILAKLLVLVGGWVAYECAVARGQGKHRREVWVRLGTRRWGWSPLAGSWGGSIDAN